MSQASKRRALGWLGGYYQVLVGGGGDVVTDAREATPSSESVGSGIVAPFSIQQYTIR